MYEEKIVKFTHSLPSNISLVAQTPKAVNRVNSMADNPFNSKLYLRLMTISISLNYR